MCSAITTNTRDYAWQMQDKPIQAADITGLALNNNYLYVDNNCSNPQANYTNSVYLVNVTGFSGTQPRVLSTRSNHSTQYMSDAHDKDSSNSDRDAGRQKGSDQSSYQTAVHAFPYPQQPQAFAPEAGLTPSTAPEPKGSVFSGGTD